MPDVRLDLEAIVGLPVGPGESARAGRSELLSVTGQPTQSLLQVLAQVPDRRCPPAGERLEQHRRADVHERAVVSLLELKKRCV